MTRFESKEPKWICTDCGLRYGNAIARLKTIHLGQCDICHSSCMVTSPNDFGHLKSDWREKYESDRKCGQLAKIQ